MRDFKPRILLLVTAFGLALVLLAVIALRYRPGSQLQTLVEALPQGIDVAMQDIDYTHIEEGRPRWRLVAEQVERQAASGNFGVSRPQMSFFDPHGEVTGSLEAGAGEVSDDYDKVSLRGDVVLQSATGYTLYTDHLDYDQLTQSASTDAPVRLVADGLHLQGTGLAFDVRQQRLSLHAHVRGSLDAAKLK